MKSLLIFAVLFVSPLTFASPVSSQLLKKIQADVIAADQDNDNLASLRGTSLNAADLRGDALKNFRTLTREFGSDYPPEASQIVLEGQVLILIVDMNDGGGEIDLYTRDGQALTSLSGGESDEWTWNN